ncbi:hypothetical protein [Microvirga arabica]|uniref:hypothetical protein n=1 Tax=Microvirga arabica TaxID=1128671 RepID=UPI00193AC388|nr:hypothetical protein [Microvirga arabica]MBM1171291.1 hypothetical protein [Microvirga arabica]
MATTINAAFDQFLECLSATPAETEAATSQKLRGESGFTGFFRVGSFENGTNVFGYSDVDYFAVIPESSPRCDSHRLLVTAAAALRSRFPNTGVRSDSPAVVLPCGQDPSESTKVMPVYDVGLTERGFRRFVIPDSSGGWISAAPDAHNEYLRAVDPGHGGRARSLIRFLKGWKHLRSVPISSFYLELVAAEYARGQEAIIYDIDLRNVFETTAATSLAPYLGPKMHGEFLIPVRRLLIKWRPSQKSEIQLHCRGRR